MRNTGLKGRFLSRSIPSNEQKSKDGITSAGKTYFHYFDLFSAEYKVKENMFITGFVE
jgi:hypothetical protein